MLPIPNQLNVPLKHSVVLVRVLGSVCVWVHEYFLEKKKIHFFHCSKKMTTEQKFQEFGP